MRKNYSLITDTTPATLVGEAGTMAEALELAMAETKPVFVQQYLTNGTVGKSWTVAGLKAALKK